MFVESPSVNGVIVYVKVVKMAIRLGKMNSGQNMKGWRGIDD